MQRLGETKSTVYVEGFPGPPRHHAEPVPDMSIESVSVLMCGRWGALAQLDGSVDLRQPQLAKLTHTGVTGDLTVAGGPPPVAQRDLEQVLGHGCTRPRPLDVTDHPVVVPELRASA